METLYLVSFGSSYETVFRLTESQIDSIPLQGDADYFVSALLRQIPDPCETEKDRANLASDLRQCGAWNDEELSEHAENLKRALWLACLDAQEGNGNVCFADGSELPENHPYASR